MEVQLSSTAQGALDHECPVLVLGGPGSGKTTLSLLKAQAMLPTLQPGQEILFISFSRAAVRQVEIRCRDILRSEERRQIVVRTYHAFAMDILQAHGRLLTGHAPRIIYPGDENLSKAVFEGDWGAETERLARDEGRYVFGQFAAAAAQLVAGSTAVASLLANKYPVIILDEFQDTDDSQWALVKALSARSETVFMADPDQRIFDYDARVDPERLNHLRAHLGPAEFDLSGENHRSPDAGILQYANAVLSNQPLPDTKDVITRAYWANAFDGTVHAGVVWMLGSLRKAGIAHPSVVVLARTNALVGKLSTILGQEHNFNGQTIKPIEHDVLWDADLTAAAALVVASILEWPSRPKDDALGQTFDRIADYFDAKNAANASNAARQTSERYRTAAERARGGETQRLTSAKVLTASYDSNLVLQGDPARDWLYARDLLAAGNDLSDLLANAKFVRLFRATDEIGSRLASAWDLRGSYGRAIDLVRRALEAGRLQSDQRDPRGCVLMTIHKAKGKEFDGVLLVEGQYQGSFFRETDTDAQRAASRRLLRVGITRARHQVVIIRPRGAIPLGGS
ncbi:ATP-dependent helicase [Nocardia farcinica]|uniref:UvrD-helicase domain-containing protein n=1 Tax=Nocardia farcinica TaxID=37329 RepID=UPI0018955E9C|nr:ATP-dependent helicase [Nocardia farcinica]MBF6421092.1 ATP-dependent helicase [Nocardia farcinica]MBF6432749.1 ATP-dependent helicase [Nocardia farcinica]MBF6503337.1 ATP-dependent helicase [Nocardia farcinica]